MTGALGDTRQLAATAVVLTVLAVGVLLLAGPVTRRWPPKATGSYSGRNRTGVDGDHPTHLWAVAVLFAAPMALLVVVLYMLSLVGVIPPFRFRFT